MTNLFKTHWQYLLAALALPPLFLFVKSKIELAASGGHSQAAQQSGITNLKAFLVMIQYAEGTYGKDAYRTLYGGSLFNDYSWHPNIAITRSGITSTAAGAYQILYGTWVGIAQSIGLADFSPLSQDRAAVALIARRGALQDVLAGRFEAAVYKCRREWASFPGAGYGQGERGLATLTCVYQQAGGQMA